VLHPDVLRQRLDIPETKLITCAVAIGYPQEDAPVNQVRSDREPLETFANWYGFSE